MKAENMNPGTTVMLTNAAIVTIIVIGLVVLQNPLFVLALMFLQTFQSPMDSMMEAMGQQSDNGPFPPEYDGKNIGFAGDTTSK